MILLINKPLEICLKLTGLWPYDFNIVGPLMVMSTVVTTLPFQFWNALDLSSDSVLLMDSLSDIFAEVLIFIKLLFMWKNKRYIKDLLVQIYDEWSVKILPDEWIDLAWYSRTFCTIDVVVYLTSGFFYYPDVITSYVGKSIEERKLLFSSKYPFNTQASPVYEILFLMQATQGTLMMVADSLSKTLLVALIIHVSVHVELLKYYIQNYSSDLSGFRANEGHEISKDLKLVIRQHLKILALVREIDLSYSGVAFFQLVLSNIMICVTGFVIITALQLANAMLLVKFILFIIMLFSQAFTFCFAGQYLRNKGESITHMVYNTFWYNTDSKEVKAVAFVLSKAQVPLILNGGKLFELSINSFTTIVKTSVSYLSVLRAVYA